MSGVAPKGHPYLTLGIPRVLGSDFGFSLLLRAPREKGFQTVP